MILIDIIGNQSYCFNSFTKYNPNNVMKSAPVPHTDLATVDEPVFSGHPVRPLVGAGRPGHADGELVGVVSGHAGGHRHRHQQRGGREAA